MIVEMTPRRRLTLTALVLAASMLLAPALVQAQSEFRQYPGFEGEDSDAPLPADWKVPGELVIGRLMYPSAGYGFFGARNWQAFQEGLRRVFPDRPILALKDDHPIFHTLFDLPHMTSVLIPNMNSL